MTISEYEIFGGPVRHSMRIKLADGGLLQLLPPSGDGEQIVINAVGGADLIISYPSKLRIWTSGEVQGE